MTGQYNDAENGRPDELPRAIFILGPTASGKTDLAVALCECLPVEIVSVDSTQVYRGLDIGSAKPSAQVLQRAPHRLIDIRDPAEAYSAAEFIADARREMAAIVRSGNIPLLVGGTMLYFRALIEGLSELPAADPQVRREIDAMAREHGWSYVHRQLQLVDPETAGKLHPNHSQRIQRALEIYRITGVPVSDLLQRRKQVESPVEDQYRIIQFALMPHNRSLLHERLATRFRAMLDQGLLAEVQKLHRRGDLTLDTPAMRSVGYRQLWEHLEGENSLEEAEESAIVATRQLVKRQLTWLRSWKNSSEIQLDNENGWLHTTLVRDQILEKLSNDPIYSDRRH